MIAERTEVTRERLRRKVGRDQLPIAPGRLGLRQAPQSIILRMTGLLDEWRELSMEQMASAFLPSAVMTPDLRDACVHGETRIELQTSSPSCARDRSACLRQSPIVTLPSGRRYRLKHHLLILVLGNEVHSVEDTAVLCF